MLRTLIAWVSLILLAASPALSQEPRKPAPKTAPTERSCRTFVQAFYDGYLREVNKENVSSDLTLKYRPSALSRELRRQLAEDSAAQDKSPEYIVGLDFDPFLNAQDTADRYVTGAVRRRGSSYRVEVYGYWNGKKNAKPDVVPELAYQAGRWTFVNFHYGTKPSENLLSILKELREERKKNPG
jgi:hypothetical protein